MEQTVLSCSSLLARLLPSCPSPPSSLAEPGCGTAADVTSRFLSGDLSPLTPRLYPLGNQLSTSPPLSPNYLISPCVSPCFSRGADRLCSSYVFSSPPLSSGAKGRRVPLCSPYISSSPLLWCSCSLPCVSSPPPLCSPCVSSSPPPLTVLLFSPPLLLTVLLFSPPLSPPLLLL